MRCLEAVALLFFTSIIAAPTSNSVGDYQACPAGLHSNAQCCNTDSLGVTGLDCSAPSKSVVSGDDFKKVCAAAGKLAKCCVVPFSGQSLLCQDAIGGGGNSPSNDGGDPPNNGGGNPPNNGGGNPPIDGNGYQACPAGIYSNLQCCNTDVLGVADLECSAPSITVKSGDDFKKVCAANGKTARCCAIPVAGQNVLCQDAIAGGGSPPGNGGGNPPNNGGVNPPNNGGGNPPNTGPNPGNNYQACPQGLYSNAQCCTTDVLGVATTECSSPFSTPKSGDDLKRVCAASGKQAKCCAIPVPGQSLLCQDAPGGSYVNNGGGNPPNNGGGSPPF